MNENLPTGLNLRAWLQAALEAKGGAFKGGGFGCDGQADIDVEIEGFQYNVSIKPLLTTSYNARTEAAAAGDVPSPIALGSPDQTLVAVGGPPCGKKFCPRHSSDPLCEPCAHEAIGRLRNTNETLFTERQEALRREDRQRLRAAHLQAGISSMDLICREHGKLPHESFSEFIQRFAGERHSARLATSSVSSDIGGRG